MTRLTDVLVSLSPTAAILLKVSILLAAAWAVHALLRISRSDARWRLLLWRGLMAGLLLVPAAQWLGGWEVFVKRPAALPAETVAVTRIEKPAGPVQPIPSTVQAPAVFQTPPAPNKPNAPVAKRRFSISAWAGERKPQLLLAGWLIGAGVMFLRSWALLTRIRRMRLGAKPASPKFQSLLDRVAREMGRKKPVLLRFGAAIETPFLTGLLRPAVVLPDRMEGAEYEEDLPGVLAHEVAHIRAHDLWWMALGRFVSTLLWFHPLAWRLRAAHGAACEEVCDAAAAQYVGSPAAYTSTLARVALAIVRPVPSAGGIPMARSSQIISRLRLLERGVRTNPIRRGRLFLCMAVGAVAFGAFSTVRLIYAASPGTATASYTVTIEGRVTDAVTEKPVAGADVRGWVCMTDFRPDRAERSAQQEVKTDGDGRYRLKLASPLTSSGEYKWQDCVALTVRAAGYGTRPVFPKGSVTPKKLDFADVDVALGPGRKLSGRILDEQHQPVAGAHLAVGDGLSGGWDDWGAWGSATSDDKGLFEIWLNREKPKDMGQNPRLAIIKLGYGTAVQWDILQKEDLGDVVLKPGGTMKGRLVDQKGKAISGCTMDAFLYPFSRVGRAVTDTNGNWEMRGLPGKPSIDEFFLRKNGPNGHNSSYGRTRFYARLDEQSPLTQEPDYSVEAEEGKEVTAPDITLGAQGARETAGANKGGGTKVEPVNGTKAELMGRVEDFFMHNYRDISSRKTIEWGDVTTDDQGNHSIRYKCYATIWGKDVYITNEVFTFNAKGEFVGVEKVEGFPQKYTPEPIDTGTQDGLKKLVEKFFSENFRDVTSRKTMEWGQREAKDNGSASIRYMYEATFWGKNKSIMNQVFTFNAKGDFVSVDNVEGYPKDAAQ